MQNDRLFDDIFYNLYDIFFEKLTQQQLSNMYITSHNFLNMMNSLGGFYKKIKFDHRSNLKDFVQKCNVHTRINCIDYNNGGLGLSPFAWVPIYPKIMILRDPQSTDCIVGRQITELEYLFVVNNTGTFNINASDFPNIRFIGCYKANVIYTDSEDSDHKRPCIMDFENIDAIEIMIAKEYTKLVHICDNLQKIYQS